MSDKRLLIADDEAVIRFMLSEVLGEAGYSVVEAENGHKALDLYNSDIRLLITDITMPGMDGFALSRAIREYNPDLPIIMITANLDDHYKLRAEEEGINEFISKPFNIGYVCDTVERLLH